MGYKCLPQLTGLVRGEPKPNAKHRANGKAICQEAGNERYSSSVTLDRSRSHLNEYSGYTSGGKCWDAMQMQADEYRMKVKGKGGVEHERPLRSDAVIGWAAIINPPAAMTVGWTPDDYDRFTADSFDFLQQTEPRLFRTENVRMLSRHRDEGMVDENDEFGEHDHLIGDAIDADGRYCGNLLDAALMVKINEGYPAFMRERGWDIEDADLTDFKRMGKNPDGTYVDPEYRAERQAAKAAKKAGRSVNKYVADKTRENYEDAAEMLEFAAQSKIDARHEYVVADGERRKAQREAGQIVADAQTEAEGITEAAKTAAKAHRKAVEAQVDILKAEAVERLNEADKAATTLEKGVSGLDYFQGLVEYAKNIKFKDGTTFLGRYNAERKRRGLDAMTTEEAQAAIEAAEAERQRRAEAIAQAGEKSEAVDNQVQLDRYKDRGGKEF